MFATKRHAITNSMLLWWTLDRVPLLLVIKPRVVKDALQCRSQGRAQVQSYVNQTELTSKMNLRSNYCTLVERLFRSKNI